MATDIPDQLKLVVFYDGIVGPDHQFHFIVRSKTDQEAIAIASKIANEWKDSEDDWYSINVSEYVGGMSLKPCKNCAILNPD